VVEGVLTIKWYNGGNRLCHIESSIALPLSTVFVFFFFSSPSNQILLSRSGNLAAAARDERTNFLSQGYHKNEGAYSLFFWIRAHTNPIIHSPTKRPDKNGSTLFWQPWNEKKSLFLVKI
jgi:hypothetical protein